MHYYNYNLSLKSNIMKYLLFVLFIIASHYYVSAQPEGCDNDTIAPTFELPMYLTTDTVYACLDSVPLLTGPPYPDVMDLVFETLEDNCLSPEWAPWYGPTLSAGILESTDTSITYTFTAYDDAPNYNTQQLTFYFGPSCTDINLSITEQLNSTTIIYPNPSNGTFTITSKYEYQILNYMGVVQDPSNLSNGIYLIKVKGIVLKNKLIIQK